MHTNNFFAESNWGIGKGVQLRKQNLHLVKSC